MPSGIFPPVSTGPGSHTSLRPSTLKSATGKTDRPKGSDLALGFGGVGVHHGTMSSLTRRATPEVRAHHEVAGLHPLHHVTAQHGARRRCRARCSRPASDRRWRWLVGRRPPTADVAGRRGRWSGPKRRHWGAARRARWCRRTWVGRYPRGQIGDGARCTVLARVTT